MDRHTKEQRSYNMSRVKNKDTKPELRIFQELEELGYKFEKHYPIIGKPDIAFPEYKIVVFIDGEFWHGRRYKNDSNSYTDFWKEKIGKNIKRDKSIRRVLKKDGWKVIRLWDKDITKDADKQVEKIEKALNSP